MSQVGIFGKLKQLVGAKPLAPLPVSKAEALYHNILQASRAPLLYRDYGVEDSIDGRFDCLCLFQSLVTLRLSGRGPDLGGLSQELFDAMFLDMDMTLREMGVGDMGVGKRVKFMSEAYMGRLSAYDVALQDKGPEQLEAALHRNLFREGEVQGQTKALAVQVRALVLRLNGLDDDALLAEAVTPDLLSIAPLQR